MRSLLVAALLAAPAAWAQKVVILEIDGDAGGRLRAQVEAAVRGAPSIELVPLSAYRDSAARKKLKGGAAMTAAGVARVGRVLRLDAAVGGDLSATHYNVVIYDRSGQELWTKSLAVKKGLLSDDFAKKLARAVVAAAETGAQRASADTGGADTGGGDEGATDSGGGNTMPEVDVSGGSGGDEGRTVVEPRPDVDRDMDLDTEGRKKKSKFGHPIVRFWLTGTTTWRSQCLRPGVSSCGQYDSAQQKPDGITINFKPTVPYLGIGAHLEVSPLAGLENRWLSGAALVGDFSYGASLTRIIEETPQGAGPEKSVTSNDLAWSFQVAWRVLFQMGYSGPMEPQPTGYAGLRFGLQARRFDIDPNAGVSLPSSQRVAPTNFGFPVLGLDASLPISKYIRGEVALSLYLSPKPSAEQIIGYGNLNDVTGGAESSGIGFEVGVAGEIWGPLGWVVRYRHLAFVDRYYGQGQKWTVCNDQQCGGVGEEAFQSIFWGVTASY